MRSDRFSTAGSVIFSASDSTARRNSRFPLGCQMQRMHVGVWVRAHLPLVCVRAGRPNVPSMSSRRGRAWGGSEQSVVFHITLLYWEGGGGGNEVEEAFGQLFLGFIPVKVYGGCSRGKCSLLCSLLSWFKRCLEVGKMHNCC